MCWWKTGQPVLGQTPSQHHSQPPPPKSFLPIPVKKLYDPPQLIHSNLVADSCKKSFWKGGRERRWPTVRNYCLSRATATATVSTHQLWATASWVDRMESEGLHFLRSSLRWNRVLRRRRVMPTLTRLMWMSLRTRRTTPCSQINHPGPPVHQMLFPLWMAAYTRCTKGLRPN